MANDSITHIGTPVLVCENGSQLNWPTTKLLWL